MKHSVLAILCVALAIAVLMGLKTRRVPRSREAVETGSVAGFQSTDEFQTFESQHLANGDGG